MAFNDINPLAPIHIIFIPKTHIPNFMKLKIENTDLLQALVSSIQTVTKIVNIDRTGFKLITNTNSDGGQLIYHFHIHLLGGKKLDNIFY